MNDVQRPKIAILYSCLRCCTVDASCEVPARADFESVSVWMDKTIQLLSSDHARRSPYCHPETLTSVKIPIAGARIVGGAAVN